MRMKRLGFDLSLELLLFDMTFKIKDMILRTVLLSFFFCAVYSMKAQELPFSDISKTPSVYNSGTLMARTVAGLGFRYYWATEDLRQEDLDFRPGDDARNSMETIGHLYDLSNFLLSAFGDQVVALSVVDKSDFTAVRKATLLNLKQAHALLISSSDEDFKTYEIPMGGGDQLPFWNVINGPIEDALWHTGQIVMMRRMSGNPLPKGVNVLMGTKN